MVEHYKAEPDRGGDVMVMEIYEIPILKLMPLFILFYRNYLSARLGKGIKKNWYFEGKY